jgi:hypothetical protein
MKPVTSRFFIGTSDLLRVNGRFVGGRPSKLRRRFANLVPGAAAMIWNAWTQIGAGSRPHLQEQAITREERISAVRPGAQPDLLFL